MQLVGMERAGTASVLTARGSGLVTCRQCTRVWPMATEICGRCGTKLRSRDDLSMQKVWAWWLTGVIAYVPANLYPMLETRALFDTQDSTIVGGAVDLLLHGAPVVALVILIASVLIPVGKFLAIAYLAVTVGRRAQTRNADRHKLFEFVEFIGRWSMIDVFVVAILSSLVQLSSLATIKPGPASLAFAISVIATMISAQSFDSRMIWDTGFPPKAPQA